MPTIRFPLAGSYNARPFVPGELSSASGLVGVGAVGVMIVGATSDIPWKDQRFVNCYQEVVQNPFTEKTSYKLVKRPGWAANQTPQSGSVGNAIMVWSGQGTGSKIISAFGATNSSIYDGTTRLTTNAADTTAITGKATGITETQISGTATLLISSSDHTAWWYQDAGTVTKVTDADFPSSIAGTFAHMDGYAFIATPSGRLYNSDLNSVTSWASTSYLSFSSYPDAGIAAVRWREYILGFGSQSVEFFRNTGNPAGSPLTRVASMTARIGLINASCVSRIDDSLFWIGTGASGSLAVYELSNGINRISTPEVEAQLMLIGTTNLSLTTLKFSGRSFVVICTSSRTFVYCVESKFWHEWISDSVYWSRCTGITTGATLPTYAISTVSTSGKTYVLNPASFAYSDDGYVYGAAMRTSNVDIETGRTKRWKSLRLISGQNIDPSDVAVSWTDDDFQTYSTPRTLRISDTLPKLQKLGSSKRRAFVFEHTNDSPMVIEAVEIDYEVNSL